jgi:hypothetical protein
MLHEVLVQQPFVVNGQKLTLQRLNLQQQQQQQQQRRVRVSAVTETPL